MTFFSIEFNGFYMHGHFVQSHTSGWWVEMARGLRMNPAKRAPNMPEHHHHVLVHVDTVGVDQKWYQRGIPPISWDGLWSVNRSNRLWPKDWQRVFLRLFWSCTLPKCSSTATKYHVQPSITIKWDWNNVYGVGGPYHYDCIPWITVESLLWWKMASNCQIVPLAPEKNSDSDSDFPTFKPTTYL